MKKKSVKNRKKKSIFSPPSREIDGDSFELLQALERGAPFKRIDDYDEFVAQSRQMAKDYFKKNARVSFRISETDLNNVKRMAASEGLPYQTFLTSIIHKLTTGQLQAI